MISVTLRPASAEGNVVCPTDLPLEAFAQEKSSTGTLEELLQELM